MVDSFTAGPGEMPYDDRDEPDYTAEESCERCGAAPNQPCADDCDCLYCYCKKHRGSVKADMTDDLNRDGSPRIDPSVLALADVSDIVARFDQAVAFATTPGACVQIAARLNVAVIALMQAQDRAFDKADSF